MSEPSALPSLDEQRRALREGALVQREEHLGTLVITGSERQSWLNGILTCNLEPLRVGSGAYGISAAKNGKIQAEVWVVLGAERILLAVQRDRLSLLQEMFERYLVMEDVEVVDGSAEFGWVFAVGPKAGALLEAGRTAGAEGARADWTGLGGAVFGAPVEKLEAVEGALLGQEGAARGSAASWEVLRVENNVGRFGVDFDEQNYPQEASLEDLAVSFNKGCYLGQEAVYMLQHRGHAKKRLVQIEVQGEGELPKGTALTLPDGTAVGTVTSHVPNPNGGGVLALGYLKFKQARKGVEVRVAGRTATVVAARGGS
ncbi:YgfZ/GcvT domain-containing protein [Chondromyces crocatus]|uniref:Aminomethyltransferase n=1 Tax=Chondromyces crocatus TaxID=52 RepID=A0A0K1EBX2_CHOCO|nr:glycine cleavage T C-terminal barrel domain-containing protein [Chondromyces crocatus]AKT38370.1 aminomethyltransferase [Chondromyces crocatus]